MKKKRSFILLTTIVLVLIVITGAFAKTPEKLKKGVEKIIKQAPGKMGVAIKNMATNETVYINADEHFPMSSVFKIPILIELFRRSDAGDIDLNRRITIKKDDIHFGSGVLKNLKPGLNPTIYDLAVLMIVVSDNSATDRVLEIVGKKNVNDFITRYKLDIKIEKNMDQLFSPLPGYIMEFARQKGYKANEWKDLQALNTDQVEELWIRAGAKLSKTDPNTCTPRAMCCLLEYLIKCLFVNREACGKIIKILNAQKLSTRLPYFLPSTAIVAHKTGYYPTVTNDSGIIFLKDTGPVIVCVFSKDCMDMRSYKMKLAIARIGRLVYEYYTQQER